MTTNTEAAIAILEKHRVARQWDDAVVAADLLAQLDLDPAGVATKAAAVTTVALADVEAAESAARAAEDAAQAADDKAHKLRAEYQDQLTAAHGASAGTGIAAPGPGVPGWLPPHVADHVHPKAPSPLPPNLPAQQATAQHPTTQAAPPAAASVNTTLPNAVPTATLPTPPTTTSPPASATVSGVTSPTPPL